MQPICNLIANYSIKTISIRGTVNPLAYAFVGSSPTSPTIRTLFALFRNGFSLLLSSEIPMLDKNFGPVVHHPPFFIASRAMRLRSAALV